MKYKALVLVLLMFVCGTTTFAHSGRTDSQGGHYNHSTGEYHFHHGYSAHQHPNGICPFGGENISQANTSSDNADSDVSNNTEEDAYENVWESEEQTEEKPEKKIGRVYHISPEKDTVWDWLNANTILIISLLVLGSIAVYKAFLVIYDILYGDAETKQKIFNKANVFIDVIWKILKIIGLTIYWICKALYCVVLCLIAIAQLLLFPLLPAMIAYESWAERNWVIAIIFGLIQIVVLYLVAVKIYCTIREKVEERLETKKRQNKNHK